MLWLTLTAALLVVVFRGQRQQLLLRAEVAKLQNDLARLKVGKAATTKELHDRLQDLRVLESKLDDLTSTQSPPSGEEP